MGNRAWAMISTLCCRGAGWSLKRSILRTWWRQRWFTLRRGADSQTDLVFTVRGGESNDSTSAGELMLTWYVPSCVSDRDNNAEDMVLFWHDSTTSWPSHFISFAWIFLPLRHRYEANERTKTVRRGLVRKVKKGGFSRRMCGLWTQCCILSVCSRTVSYFVPIYRWSNGGKGQSENLLFHVQEKSSLRNSPLTFAW